MSNRAFQPLVITDDSASGGQIIDGSLKFNSARTNYLKRYVSVVGNKKKWTCSVWVKRSRQGTQQKILEAGSSSSSFISFEFQADDKLQLFGYGDSATQLHLRTSSRYRDTSGWYHIVVYIDSANSSAKLYVNGAEPPLDTSTQPTTNYNFHINNNVNHSIGRSQTTNNYYFDGYLSQFYLIDGQALDPSYFGYTDAATGIWRPKKYTYGNYGTNGFYLPFDGNSVPTDDQSGNGNNFTAYQMRPTVPLTKATGALPIMRTNKGGSIALTGVRDDPYGSNCVVAVPGHSTLQDYSYQVGASSYKSFTNNGSVTISPEGSGQQGNQCLYRNSIKLVKANTQWIEIPFSQFNLGTGDFTIECWAMHVAHSRDMNLFNLYDGSSRKFFVQARVDNNANDFHARFYGTSNQYNSNSIEWQNNNNALNTWYHVAACRASGTFRIFLNGVLVSAEHNTGSENLGNVDRLRVGYMASDSDKYWDGFVQDIRFYNAAKYTSNFSVPSGNSNIVADSPSGVAVPRKFDYSVLENGSVTINKGSDYLNIPYSSDFDLGSSWTIEFWFYPFNTTDVKVIGTRGDSSPRGWEIVYYSGQIGIEQYGDQSTGGQQRGTKIVYPLAWHHIAITHNGTNTRTYIDGYADLNYTGSSGSNWGAGSHSLRIGRPENFDEGGRFAISNLRIVKGTVVYTTNFTPSTTPLTNITNTKLLCCNSKSSPTAATVTPNTITKNGDTLANHFNPFDVADSIGQESGYCILDTNNGGSAVTGTTLDDGGLSFTCSPSVPGKSRGTLSFTKGKFYFEWTVNVSSRVHVGVCNAYSPLVPGDFGNRNDEWGIRTDGYKVHDNPQTVEGGDGVDINNGDGTNVQGYVWMVAVDADNGKIYFGKNGCWLSGADPASGANAHYSNLSGHRLVPATGRRSGANAGLINFGATPFVYTPPEGFKTICTSNIEDEPIIDPSQHFNVLTWTGNGGTASISGLKFKPDFVWIKDRDQNGYSHAIFDTIRGATKRLFSDATNGESTQNTTLTAFDNFGFTLGSSGAVNQSSHDYVAWCWKAGGHDGIGYWRDGVEYASKTDLVSGGIVNQIGAISINTKAGFSVISFGGTGSSADLPHGLGKAPKFVLIKRYSASGNSWAVYCDGVGAGPNKQILLNSSNAVSTDNNGFNAAPDETFVHLGSGAQMATNQTGQNIAYVWAEIPGYSRFGTYYGNNSTDGTFIHCGFRPRFFLWKVLGRSGGWGIIDTARDPVNDGTEKQLGPDDDDAEGSYAVLDITSTGIKMRNTWGDTNQNYDHLFMAFAEQPASNPYGGQSNAR